MSETFSKLTKLKNLDYLKKLLYYQISAWLWKFTTISWYIPRIIELAWQTFMPIQTLELHKVHSTVHSSQNSDFWSNIFLIWLEVTCARRLKKNQHFIFEVGHWFTCYRNVFENLAKFWNLKPRPCKILLPFRRTVVCWCNGNFDLLANEITLFISTNHKTSDQFKLSERSVDISIAPANNVRRAGRNLNGLSLKLCALQVWW